MSDFIKVAKKSELPSDTGHLVQVNGRDIALFLVDGKVQAVDNFCPHQGGPLAEGGLQGKEVMCPWHGWQFDVTNGVCGFNPGIKVQTFEVKEDGDDILINA